MHSRGFSLNKKKTKKKNKDTQITELWWQTAMPAMHARHLKSKKKTELLYKEGVNL